jgi:anti-sigma-K factor RskA
VHGVIALQTPQERLETAGEYVLGTLDEADRAVFVDAMARAPELRAHVASWQDHLVGLTREAAPATPSPSLWKRIELALPAAASSRHAAPAKSGPPWWQRLSLWQGFSGLATAAALLMAVMLFNHLPDGTAANARYLALLQSPSDQSTGWVVEMQSNQTLRLVPVGTTPPVPAGRALQFWTKPQGAAGPTSLGLVRHGEKLEMPVSRLPAVGEQQLFEITLEPENGSPVGRPTGPILYVGKTVRL